MLLLSASLILHESSLSPYECLLPLNLTPLTCHNHNPHPCELSPILGLHPQFLLTTVTGNYFSCPNAL